MIWALLLIPAFFGFSCFIVRSNKIRRTILVLSAFVHLCLTVASLFKAQDNTNEWLYLDSLGLIFLLIMSFLFFGASIYAVAYLNEEEKGFIKDIEEGFLFKNVPEAVFSGCLLLFLSSMTLVTVSRHFGLLWIGMETTTLMSAPLIYYHRSHRSLEATWKYLLICSVGIALGLLGNVFLTVA
ncbi:MAG: NADH dehydrogenase FAD-containing subunit, partial [Chlamydiae bacterium]|nr:NADH dehydrogenase FAD-containing subunit [Chlamydiota bacterium]